MRYALYFAADADDCLMQLGNAWLGRDPYTLQALPQPEIDGLTGERFQHLTANPRRYGFHGTLKAPFLLRSGVTQTGLLEACEAFASDIAPFAIEGLSVNRLGKFLALTPDRTEPELQAFADICVRRFEDFRAPLTEADLERRRNSGLTPKQDAYLSEWGYPYVFDEFRFHMTLSNMLDSERDADLLAAAARTHFAEVTGRRRICSHFALYVEPDHNAPFQVLKVFELTGGTAPRDAQADAARLIRKENA